MRFVTISWPFGHTPKPMEEALELNWGRWKKQWNLTAQILVENKELLCSTTGFDHDLYLPFCFNIVQIISAGAQGQKLESFFAQKSDSLRAIYFSLMAKCHWKQYKQTIDSLCAQTIWTYHWHPNDLWSTGSGVDGCWCAACDWGERVLDGRTFHFLCVWVPSRRWVSTTVRPSKWSKMVFKSETSRFWYSNCCLTMFNSW